MRIVIVNIYLTIDTVLSPILLHLVLMLTVGGKYCSISKLRLLRLRNHKGFAFDHLVNSDRIITGTQIF